MGKTYKQPGRKRDGKACWPYTAECGCRIKHVQCAWTGGVYHDAGRGEGLEGQSAFWWTLDAAVVDVYPHMPMCSCWLWLISARAHAHAQLLAYAPLLENTGEGGRRGRGDAGDESGDKGETDDRAGPGAGREPKAFKW